MAKSRAREKLLAEMRRAAARGHRIELEPGQVQVGRSMRPGIRAVCACGWSSRWRHSKAQALAAVGYHVGQAGQEDPLWDPVVGDPAQDSAGVSLPGSVGPRL